MIPMGFDIDSIEEKTYNIGDKVWYVSETLAILCTVVDVLMDDSAFHQYVYLDEPLGTVMANELFTDIEEVKATVFDNFGDGSVDTFTLTEFRKKQIKIYNRQDNKKYKPSDFKDKERLKEWFNSDNIKLVLEELSEAKNKDGLES